MKSIPLSASVFEWTKLCSVYITSCLSIIACACPDSALYLSTRPSVMRLSLCPPRPDEADEAAPAPAGRRGAAAAQGALPEAHLADAGAGQPQADGGGHHGVRGEHDAACPAGHVQQDGQPGRSPSLAKPRPDETRVGHSARAGEVSGE